MFLLKLAFKNILRHWRIGMASLLAIAFSLVSYNVFQGYMLDVDDLYSNYYEYNEMYGHALIENTNAQTPQGRSDIFNTALTLEQQKVIDEYIEQNQTKIFTKMKVLNVSGTVTNGKTSTIFIGKGYELEPAIKLRGPTWEYNALYGNTLEHSEEGNLVNMGLGLGRVMSCNGDDPVIPADFKKRFSKVARPFNCYRDEIQLQTSTEAGQMNAIDMKVNGLVDGTYQEVDNKLVNMSLKNAQRLLNTDKISYYAIKFSDKKNVSKNIMEMNQYLKQKNLPIAVVRWTDHPVSKLFHQSHNLFVIFRNFVVTVMVSISVLAIFITLFKLINERTREIGTMRSLGYKNKQMIRIFTYETMILSSSGALIGMAMSAITSLILNSLNIYYKAAILSLPIPYQIMISPKNYLVSALLIVAVSMLISIFVTIKTLRKNIIDQLNYA